MKERNLEKNLDRKIKALSVAHKTFKEQRLKTVFVKTAYLTNGDKTLLDNLEKATGEWQAARQEYFTSIGLWDISP